jgi:uncharacterized protein YydD (DUF2326 family)
LAELRARRHQFTANNSYLLQTHGSDNERLELHFDIQGELNSKWELRVTSW